MTVRRWTFEDVFKPNYDRKVKRRAERRRQSNAYRYMEEEKRKRNWQDIRRVSCEVFGE